MKDYIETEMSSGILYTYKATTKIHFFSLFPGILLSFNDVHTASLPPMEFTPAKNCITVNFAAFGTCELLSSAGNFIYVKGGNLVLSREKPAHPFHYPLGDFFGVEIYLLPEHIDPNSLSPFHINAEDIQRNYLFERDTFIAGDGDILTPIFQNLIKLYRDNILDLSLLQLYTLTILRILTSGLSSIHPIRANALTPAQVDCAKRARQILAENIAKKIPLRILASSLNISETGLKNCFKAVYGENISTYVLNMRMSAAANFLQTTGLSISQISGNVGYENQSKFSAVFKKHFGMTPLIFRKNAPLKN